MLDPEAIYEKQELIGKGSFGAVYKGFVHHRQEGRSSSGGHKQERSKLISHKQPNNKTG